MGGKMSEIGELKNKVLSGKEISAEEALALFDYPVDHLSRAANDIRLAYCGTTFDFCTIINAKSGRCTENCKFCAQSAHGRNLSPPKLSSPEEILAGAKKSEQQGIQRYSYVTSGKAISNEEVAYFSEITKQVIAQTTLSICASFGLLEGDSYRLLKESGVQRIHNNLETSSTYFPSVCSTHTWAEKCSAIKQAQEAGLDVCSGGLFGMGETNEDRVALAYALKQLNIQSVPINFLIPLPETPFEHYTPLSMEEMRQVVAVFRFILPTAFIRLAGGRAQMPDHGRACFLGGANAAITGDLLTTVGPSVAEDMEMVRALGYHR